MVFFLGENRFSLFLVFFSFIFLSCHHFHLIFQGNEKETVKFLNLPNIFS